MRFNADRLAHLAGIQSSSSQARRLNESGNQSRHDEEYDEGYDYYQADLNEVDAAADPFAEFREDDADAEALDQLDTMEAHEEGSMEGDEVVEINETMLRREIARMRRERSKRANSSKSSLNEEASLRAAIRNEIGSIIGDLKNKNLYSTRDWLYGDKKPKNSRNGYVARGGFGIGF